MDIPDSEITFALTTDNGFRIQTEMLVESITDHMPDSNIVVFVPENSYNSFGSTYQKFLNSNSDVRLGEIPRPEYPLTALTKSFEIAAEDYDTKYYVQLDTDTILLNPLLLPADPPTSLLVKPTNLGSHFWSAEISEPMWADIYAYFDTEFPTERLQGTFDKRWGFPVWNGGVIATTDDSFPSKWLNKTEELLDSSLLSEKDFYAEQITLSVLGTSEYKITPLSIQQNYAQEYITIPKDIQILHYGNADFLPYFLARPSVYSKLRTYWSGRVSPRPEALLRRLIRIGRGRGRKYLPRERRVQLESIAARAVNKFPQKFEEKVRSLYG